MYLEANNIKFYIVEKGDPKTPLFLFIHGFPEFWHCWRHQLEAFGQHYLAVALDCRGHGWTDKAYDIEAYHLDTLV